MRAISMRIDPGVRPAIVAALYLTIAELGLFEAAAIFGAFATYVARFIIMTAVCLVAFAYLRQPSPSMRNLTVVPYLIRSLLFANTTVLLILAFSTSPSLNHTYTIFMLHIGAAYVIARLPLPLREPLTKGKLWDWPFALAIVVLLIGIYLYHFVAAEPDTDPVVAAAGLRAAVFAALAAVSFAASNIMATVFERENVHGVDGRALSSLEVTYLGCIVALVVSPVIAVLLQVPMTPPSIASVAPNVAIAFLFWAAIAASLNLPANTLLLSAFNKTSNPALVSSMDALVMVFAIVPDLLWHGEPASSLIGTKGIGLALILVGGAWAIYRDAKHSSGGEAIRARSAPVTGEASVTIR
jgi:hypothetical protein